MPYASSSSSNNINIHASRTRYDQVLPSDKFGYHHNIDLLGSSSSQIDPIQNFMQGTNMFLILQFWLNLSFHSSN